MKFGNYVPDRGDIVWLEFDPQVGMEIQKTRPALTLSPKAYNERSGLGLFVPVTSSIKGYPFEVLFKDKKVGGVILADQVKSFDWRQRNAQKITVLDEKSLNMALQMVRLLVQ
jgi:mRNA interferase MazF